MRRGSGDKGQLDLFVVCSMPALPLLLLYSIKDKLTYFSDHNKIIFKKQMRFVLSMLSVTSCFVFFLSSNCHLMDFISTHG